MSDPTRRNRLDEEASPYLRQHADNPVHWQPWDDDAFEAAAERDVPVFLSVGYSACHWCHVMAEESFADDDVAETVNEHFVPVKVDREERPDVDDVYMTVAQLVRGGGGWPLSVFLTPDRRPFWVGTYVPKEATRNQPGFEQLLEDVHEAWETDRESIEERADQWAAAARGELEAVPDEAGDPPGAEVLSEAAADAVRSADRANGGFGRQPKFPQPGRVRLLLRAARELGGDDYREVAADALDAMANGGLYDHLGGGFHRYCTDSDWTVPHFEKMLYDQAELSTAYLAGYQATGEERYADVVESTLAFTDRELGHDAGGFFSTLDARSDGVEGKFYVWTPGEVREVLGDDDLAALACDRWGITDAGNFEGATVLTADASLTALADEYGLSEDEAAARVENAREALFAARSSRTRPARDEKIIGSWNGLMVSAFARAGLAFDDEYAARAADALGFVREHLWSEDENRLARRWKDGDVKGDGYLEDYAFLARGALDTYAATGDHDHLAFALDLARALCEVFYDADVEALYAAPASDDLLARPQDLTDQSTPSPAGVAVDVLQRLDAFAPDEAFGDIVDAVLSTHAETIENSPLQHVSLVDAAVTRANGLLETTVAADRVPDEWRALLTESYRPDLLLTRRPRGDGELDAWLDDLGVAETPAIWADRGARDGADATAYVCRRACSPPLHETAEVDSWLADFAVTP
ncbi:thioredoxin domain-containing protein [Halocalculus aciditolerans]|uniref:Thioredoxin domain-containing protein n=1 Tax=Halocalculus aciditolerans TaxID=1383812 RepID=A0A830F1M5_9EURY|nr:thioredoxin domain-containing protein [Halocalculus aciditolerans]GGL53726.1 thioredoxin domain-containing protein [Halocalculus aciditolerans]